MFAMSSSLAAGAVRAGPSTARRANNRSSSSIISASGVPASKAIVRSAKRSSALAGQPVVSARCVH